MRKEVLRIGISISIEIGFDDRNKMKHLIVTAGLNNREAAPGVLLSQCPPSLPDSRARDREQTLFGDQLRNTASLRTPKPL